MAGQVLFLTPSFFLRGGHVTPNSRLGHSKTHFIRLRACSNIEGSRHSSNVPHQKEGGKNGQTFIVKALDAVKPVLKLASTNFLPLALISGVIIGLINPVPGCLAQKCSLSKWSTFGIFLISGFNSVLYAVCFNASFATEVDASRICYRTVYFLLHAYYFIKWSGLDTACWGQLCSCSCIDSDIKPSWHFNYSLYAFKVHGSRCWGFYSCKAIVKEPYNDSFGALIARKGVAKFVDRRRQVFSMISSICLSLVPWMQVSGSRTLILTVSPGKFIIAIAIGLCLHFLFLTWNMIMMQTLSVIMRSEGNVFVKKENAQAIMIVASQKTLPVMVAIVEQLGGVLGEAGLLVLPCIAAHINQIIVDSLLVNIWLQRDKVSSHIKEI